MVLMAMFGHQLKVATQRSVSRQKAEEIREQYKKSLARKAAVQDKKLTDLNALKHELMQMRDSIAHENEKPVGGYGIN